MNTLNVETPTIESLKKQREEKQSSLFTDCGVFFAFSNEQFEKNKTPLTEGDKYVSFMGGGYCPKSNIEKLKTGFDILDNEYWAAIDSNGLKGAVILYELCNHECFYTGDWREVKKALPEAYTDDEIKAVYYANRDEYMD